MRSMTIAFIPSPRRLLALVAGLALLATAACTTTLSADEGEDDGDDEGNGIEVAGSWPQTDTSARTGSPLGDVELATGPVLRADDGTATVRVVVTNDGSEEVSLGRVTGFDDLRALSMFDPETGDRWLPVQTENGTTCVCSYDPVVPAGEELALRAVFAEVPASLSEVRLALPSFRPIESVEVAPMTLSEATTARVVSHETADLRVKVAGVWRTEEGTLARIRLTNNSADVLYDDGTPSLFNASLIDADSFDASYTRTDRDSQAVVSPLPDDGIARGQTVTRSVLFAPLPSSTDRVLVRMPGAEPSVPVSLSEEEPPSSSLETSGLDEPESASLETGPRPGAGELIPLGEYDAPPVSESGPSVDLPEPVDTLTSPVAPGYRFAPRAVVRTGEAQVQLYAELSASEDAPFLPNDVLGEFDDLGNVALIDPQAKRRYGALSGDTDSFGSSTSYVEGTRLVHEGYPSLDPDSESVTVDVPGFGQVPDVPVIDAPTGDNGGGVLASSRLEDNGRLRMDVLALSRLGNEAGTLLRVRMVNESDPDAVETPFSDSLCDAYLVDTDTNRRFFNLDPCTITDWYQELGSGESLVYEVRMPDLPDDVDRLAVTSAGWAQTPVVPIGEDTKPAFLNLPAPADPPAGDTGTGSVGVADDLQTEVRDGDEVELRLDTDVLFAFGSDQLTPAAQSRLADIAQRLADQTTGTVEVVGHTDSVGEEAANQALSERRAEAVRAALASATGNAIDYEVSGEGESDPVAPNEVDGVDNPDGRARNRRVTLSYTAG